MVHQYKDGGWAWMSVVGAAWCMFSVVASFKSQGILFVEFLSAFDASNALTAWMMGVTACGMSFFSPAATYFANRYTCRVVIIVGTLLCSLSALVTSFAPNIYFVICIYGVVTGIGYACLLGPSLMMINMYFEKRRTLANGLALSGASIGQLVIPIMMTSLIKYYTVWGALTIYSAFLFNGFVAALLMRPISFYQRSKKSIATHDLSPCDKDQMCSKQDLDNQDEELHSIALSDNSVAKTEKVKLRADSDNLSNHSTNLIVQCFQNISKLYNWAHLKNSLYLLYLGACIFGNSSYVDLSMMMPPFAASLDISKEMASYLLAIVGIGDFFGRVFGGIFAYFKIIKTSQQMSLAMITIGVATIICTSVPCLASLFVLCGVLGLFGGAYVSVYTIVLVDFLGLQAFPSAFGLMIMFQGMFNTALPPLLGWMKDVTGNYQASYFLMGSCMILSGSFLLLEPCARKIESMKVKTNNQNMTEKINTDQDL